MEYNELKVAIENFFLNHYQQYTVNELMKKLDIDRGMIDIVLDCLFDLEKDGKIFNDNNHTYVRVPLEFYYEVGVLCKSNSNHYYINLADGKRILIKDIGHAKVGDYVYVSKNPGNHPMCYVGEIKRIIKREISYQESHYIVQGILRRDGNNLYILVNDKKIYIPKEQLNTAFINDLVNVKVNGRIGSVIEVLKRHSDYHVFECVDVNGELKWKPIGTSSGIFDLPRHKYRVGDRISARINGNKLQLVDEIRSGNSIQDLVDGLILDYGFQHEFSSQVLDEALRISRDEHFFHNDKRVDLRNLETFTIDPIDAKDLDDAVSITYHDGIYSLYVHTANPSHYIQVHSSIFQEALRRAFSVYPVTNVIPMLPDVFSSGVCSLNEDGDKLAFTCRLDIDKSGKIIDFDIFKSIIHSNKQMNYDAVNNFFNGDGNPEYMPFKDSLLLMRNLAKILDQKKNERGALSFSGEEKGFVLDEDNNPIGINEEQRGEAQMLIENFMLLANERVATYAHDLGLPYIYRNHDKPTVQKGVDLKNNLIQNGYFIKKIDNIDNPSILQKYLLNLLKGKGKEEKKVISEIVLKSMTRAFYDLKNIGHYGLALECYGTFTSPARKVSDLINHMVIEEFLDSSLVDSEAMDFYRSFISEWCEYISLKQRDADMLEQDIEQLMLSRYADAFLGEEVKARVLFVNHSGIYVKDEHGLTGMIPLNKNAVLKNHGVVFNGREFFPNEQIIVKLKSRHERDLIFELGLQPNKENVKKRVRRKDSE